MRYIACSTIFEVAIKLCVLIRIGIYELQTVFGAYLLGQRLSISGDTKFIHIYYIWHDLKCDDDDGAPSTQPISYFGYRSILGKHQRGLRGGGLSDNPNSTYVWALVTGAQWYAWSTWKILDGTVLRSMSCFFSSEFPFMWHSKCSMLYFRPNCATCLVYILVSSQLYLQVHLCNQLLCS